MAPKFFGQYLLENGVIDRETLLEALALQSERNLSLDQLAHREGLLNAEGAASVVAAFRGSQKTIEQILIERDLLSTDQIARLRQIQHKEYLRIGEAIVATGRGNKEEIEARLTEFESQQHAEQQQLEKDFSRCRDGDIIDACLKTALFHFQRVTGTVAKIEEFEEAVREVAPANGRYAQELVGNWHLAILLDFPAHLAELVASRMIGMEVGDNIELRDDAVCELLNLVVGNACIELEKLGHRMKPKPPFMVVGDRPLPEAQRGAFAHIIAGEDEFDFLLLFCEESFTDG